LVELFCDGACQGNPGPGGWAFLLRFQATDGAREKEGRGAEAPTTNNRMELKGAIEGLSALRLPCDVRLYCDSQYVVKGIGRWLADWKARGWRKADGKPPLNEDLWRELDGLLGTHRVEAAWVEGHAGHAENERVDRMAREMAKGLG
jgi:ribonuclease HI